MNKILSKIYYGLLNFLLPYGYSYFEYYYQGFQRNYGLKSEIINVGKERKNLSRFKLQNKNKNTKYLQIWSIKQKLKSLNTEKYQFIDIGSGWGSTLIYFNHYLNFKKMIGIENQNKFVDTSKKIIRKNNLNKIKIIKKNAVKFKWKENSIVFINLPDKEIINKMFEFNATNILKKKNIVIVVNHESSEFFKRKKLLKNYRLINCSLLRYYIFLN